MTRSRIRILATTHKDNQPSNMDHEVIDHESTCGNYSIDALLIRNEISSQKCDETDTSGAESMPVHYSQTCALRKRKATHAYQCMATIKEETKYDIEREANIIPCVSLRTIASAAALAMSIIKSAKRRKWISVSDSIQLMIILLQYGNAKEKEIGACAIHRLAVDNKNRSLIAQRRGIPPLLDLIENGTISQKNQAIAAIAALTVRHDSNKILVAKAGGILPILHLTHKGTDKQKSLALRALYCLAKHEKIRDEIFRKGGIPPIIELIEDDGTTSELKRIASATFELFCTHNRQ